MAKRFTDSKKWNDAWFMDLPSKYKLFWLYMLDECDHAGIWKVNFKVASFYVGEHLEHSEVTRILSERITILSDEYWFLNKFIKYQYNCEPQELNPKSPVHLSILKSMDKHLKLKGYLKGIDRLCHSVKDKDKDKDKVKDKVKEEEDLFNFDSLLKHLNKSKGSSHRTVSDKAKRSINARIKEGFTTDDIKLAISNACVDSFHKDNNFKFITLEYITRQDQLDKWLQATVKKHQASNNPTYFKKLN